MDSLLIALLAVFIAISAYALMGMASGVRETERGDGSTK
jgi:hypothetical protein